jgi:hypothetical protein
MNRLTRTVIAHNLPAIFTIAELKRLEPGLFKEGVLNERLLAALFYPESYISFETALWDAGWIPDFVFEVASATVNRSFEVETDFALFSYTEIRQKNMESGTYRTQYQNRYVLEAKPLKALADYVCSFEYDWHTVNPLIKSLRIDSDNLETLTAADFDELQGNYEAPNVERFLEGIRKELQV